MCGILLSLSKRDKWDTSWWDPLCKVIADRGPDTCALVTFDTPAGSLKTCSSVLSIRPPLTDQPIVSKNGSMLQFNGELYNENITGNDTQYTMEYMEQLGVPEALRVMKGEYAFTYYDAVEQKIWFARDPVGRRSLLCILTNDGLALSSVGQEGTQFEEVNAHFVFCFDILKWEITSVPHFRFGNVFSELCDTSGREWDIELERLLELAVKRRVDTIYKALQPTIDDVAHRNPLLLSHVPQRPVRLAILFSGGLDCTLIAMLAHRVVPENESIDLLNVAFENKRTGGQFATPDRLLGRRSHAELIQVCKTKSDRFRFVEVDVPYEEALEHKPAVMSLMWPKNSVMDYSIALAFYFASRGIGTVHGEPYHSTVPVLLSGLGADELFGGYTRHVNKIERNFGYAELAKELDMDFERLHYRNLGRDDRVCATWGREVRYPFLDEQVITWALDCPIDSKVGKESGQDAQSHCEIVQSKRILRQIARRNGFRLVSEEKKRAIQFGARSAKMDPGSGKAKGTDTI